MKKLSIHKATWKQWESRAKKAEASYPKKDYLFFEEVNKNYLVFYSKNCDPHIKQFKSLPRTQKFVAEFHRNSDNWVDFIVAGRLIRGYEGLPLYVKEGVRFKTNKGNE